MGSHTCDFPTYDMRQWFATHGMFLPDHPAVFVGDGQATNSWKDFAKKEHLVEMFGDIEVMTKPEYALDGGHLGHLADYIYGSRRMKLKEFVQDSNSFQYLSDFSCSNLCARLIEYFEVPALFEGPVWSMNLLLGGEGTGLPFHKHEHTWQALVSGRKAWYVVPPGGIHSVMSNITGPFVFPPRVFRKTLHDANRFSGPRPLYCVQQQGQVAYIPDGWWHATFNIDEYQLAFGGKLKRREQKPSVEKAAILKQFLAAGRQSNNYTLSYALRRRAPIQNVADRDADVVLFDFVSLVKHADDAVAKGSKHAYDTLLAPLEALAASAIRERSARPEVYGPLASSAAFAHCTFAKKVESRVQATSPHIDVTVCPSCWYVVAASLHPEVYAIECGHKHDQVGELAADCKSCRKHLHEHS